jgi:hypothetical protein
VPTKNDAKIIITIPELSEMPTMTELPVNDTNSSNQVSSTPIVSTIGKSGRLFGPDQDRIFKSIGSDLIDEGSGIMQMLADKGIMRHGYNNIVDEHDHNYTVANCRVTPNTLLGMPFLSNSTAVCILAKSLHVPSRRNFLATSNLIARTGTPMR